MQVSKKVERRALSAKPVIDSAAKEKIFAADISNIVRKVKAGRPLSATERKTIAQTEEPPTATPPAGTPGSPQRNRAAGLRWNIETAAREFGVNPRTVSGRVHTAGVLPGEDGLYSTADIASAIFGDIAGERLRLTRESADKVALDNARTRRTHVETEAVYLHFQGVYAAFRARILASGLLAEEKAEIIQDLKRLTARDLAAAPPVSDIEFPTSRENR